MRTSQWLFCLLSFLTGFGILLQWILVLYNIFPVEEKISGYRNYFLSFLLADVWLIMSALLTGIYILLKKPKATLFGIILGSSMVFFGLYSFLYDFNTKLLFDFSLPELFGKFVTFYNIIAGLIFIVYFWRTKDSYIERVSQDSYHN